MALAIQINGVIYEQQISMSVQRAIDNACGFFNLRASSQEDNLLPIKRGDSVKILADGKIILSGFAERVEPRHSARNHTISVSGRDITGDIVDSSVSGEFEFDGSVNLEEVARRVLDNMNLQSVKVINETGSTIEPFTEEDTISASVGEKAFEFINRYAAKRQVIATTDGLGNLTFIRSGTTQLPVKLALGYNILEGHGIYDDSKRYRQYVTNSQLSPTNLDENTDTLAISDQSGEALDSAIRSSRIMIFDAEESMDDQTCLQRAILEANLRRTNGFIYNCVVQGHSIEGSDLIWRPNRLVPVVDEFCGIDATLLIRAVRWVFDIESGSTTELSLTYRDAYSIQAEVDRIDAETNSYGSGF